eukprot:TRINITY_DN409_c3_g1_i1.p1 TRINITY_DN409_c3_g1~~TRINITY_DN409_c3_g1_i1.p1  ORF type:complete len:449 (+),score=106.88 TRINITY_DN409_c3_g1_i1:36-1349(+)
MAAHRDVSAPALRCGGGGGGGVCCALCGVCVGQPDEFVEVCGEAFHRACWLKALRSKRAGPPPMSPPTQPESDVPRLPLVRSPSAGLLVEQTKQPPEAPKEKKSKKEHLLMFARRPSISRLAGSAPPALGAAEREQVATPPPDTSCLEGRMLTEKSFKKVIIDTSSVQLCTPPVGEGAMGIVYKATLNGRTVAVKMMKDAGSLTQEQRDEFIREMCVLRKIKNPHIVRFIGGVVTREKLWLVTEFMPEGTLKKALQSGPLPLPLKVRIALDTSRAMSALHQHNIIYRDLKAENVMINKLDVNADTSTVKITDFGTSRIIRDSHAHKEFTRGVGTPLYMAPEILRGESYDKSADVYSFGIFFWEVLTQKEPYTEFSKPWEITKYVVTGGRPPIPADTPDDVAYFLTLCWTSNPEKRPTFLKIVAGLTAVTKSMLSNQK